MGISTSNYTDITDAELDGVMQLLVTDFPQQWHCNDVGPASKYENKCDPSKST